MDDQRIDLQNWPESYSDTHSHRLRGAPCGVPRAVAGLDLSEVLPLQPRLPRARSPISHRTGWSIRYQPACCVTVHCLFAVVLSGQLYAYGLSYSER
jgi:hypothetical protein